MSQSIGQKFTPFTLLKFAFPSIIMMVFMSCYTIVDGIFVSRFAGSDALSSLNIVYPVINILMAVGIMLATGGSAIVGKRFGEGNFKKAREDFSFLVVFGLIFSFILLFATLLFSEKICYLLGSTDALLPNCKAYLITLMLFAPACMLQSLYQSFFITDGRPDLGLTLTIIGGISNAVLDYVFLAVLDFGIAGAAIATGIGQCIPAVIGTIYFFIRKGDLYFSRFSFSKNTLFSACSNGSSEMVTNLSNAVVTYLFNIILMRLAGADGVAAITIILYGQFLFNSLYLGFSLGVAPVISFQYGAKKEAELKSTRKICLYFLLTASILITILSQLMAKSVVGIFVAQENPTYALASTGFSIFAFCYLFSGFNIFSSNLFTALSDGKTSAIISFVRTFGCIVISLLVLPNILGITGVWLAIPVAEFITLFLCIYYQKKKRAIYHY